MLDNPIGIRLVNPVTYIDKENPPFLILHGSNVPTVPPNQSEALPNALKAAGVTTKLYIIQGAGYGGPEFGQPEIQHIPGKFLSQRLERKGADGISPVP